MTLKDDLGLLYCELIQQKLWCDRLAERETNTEKKQAYKGEAYINSKIAYDIRRMMSEHFKYGNDEAVFYEEQAKNIFKRQIEME